MTKVATMSTMVQLSHLLLTVILWVGLEAFDGEQFKPRNHDHTGGWVTPTRGEVWPKPKLQKNQDMFMGIRKSTFKFKITSGKYHGDCDILNAAILRYPSRLFPPVLSEAFEEANLGNLVSVEHDPNFIGWLDEVEIVMNNKKGCEKYPHLDMDEHYEVKVNSPDEPKRGRIIAFSVWGILRGMETFSQMVYVSNKYGNTLQYLVNGTQTLDSPRFPHRGVMLDTSRHYIAKSVLRHNLDLMEMSKFNVFHWHVVDDNSFPFVSKTFPNLSLAGAFNSKVAVYTPQDVADIVEYARLRGIRVLSEFDTPGHTAAFGPGQPDLLTECYTGDRPNGFFGPVNPIKDQVYDFMKKFFQEVVTVFPDKFLHLGGDEVDFKCWQSNPSITEWMAKNNITGDYKKLESIYIQKLLDIVSSYPTKNGYIVWQEVFDNNVMVKNDTIIHIWKDIKGWESEMQRVTSKNLRAILSSPWYLNYISYGSDWSKYYIIEPLDFFGSADQKKLVLGGEACMWSEFVNSVNLLPRTWPRACAVAERLWSPAHVRDLDSAKRRIQEMECRLLQRGYPVEPINGPAFCNIDWNL